MAAKGSENEHQTVNAFYAAGFEITWIGAVPALQKQSNIGWLLRSGLRPSFYGKLCRRAFPARHNVRQHVISV